MWWAAVKVGAIVAVSVLVAIALAFLYQTVQAADWIAGLVGRLGACWKEPAAWPENAVFRRYFEPRLGASRSEAVSTTDGSGRIR